MGVLLRLENVRKTYGGVVALKGVDMEVLEGEIHSLVGENGSGKSTLVKIVTGVVQPENGSIVEINGKRFESLTPVIALRMGVHVVHQDLSLFPNLTVAENIAIHEYVLGRRRLISWRKIRNIATRVVETLGLDIDLEKVVGELPLADQQLVAIARAIASEGRLIILDEPTAALTSEEVEKLFSYLRKLKNRGVSVLFISHRLDEVLEISDRITVLKDGEKVGTFESNELDKRRLAYLMTGKDVSTVERKGGGEGEEVVLRVENLTKRGQFEKVSFELRKGEVLGIIGPRGAGRTELALAIFGMNKPDHGKIEVEGRKVYIKSSRDAVRLGIAYVPENRLTQGLVLDQPIAHNLVITLLRKISNALGFLLKGKIRETVENAVRSFGIKVSDPRLPVRTLSGGNQQKVVLAKWIMKSPKVLILDGPTIGIDVAAKESVYEIVREYAGRGMGIIFISDEAHEILTNSDRVILMKNGRFENEFRPDELDESTLDSMIKGGG